MFLRVFFSSFIVSLLFSFSLGQTDSILHVTKTIRPDTIWLRGSGMQPETATVTMNAVGVGSTFWDTTTIPVDVILSFDNSGSMWRSYETSPTCGTDGVINYDWMSDQMLTQYGECGGMGWAHPIPGVPREFQYRNFYQRPGGVGPWPNVIMCDNNNNCYRRKYWTCKAADIFIDLMNFSTDRVALNTWGSADHGIIFEPGENYINTALAAHHGVDSIWLDWDGGTPLYAGIDSSFLFAIKNRQAGKNTVIIMLSDGGDGGTTLEIPNYRNPFTPGSRFNISYSQCQTRVSNFYAQYGIRLYNIAFASSKTEVNEAVLMDLSNRAGGKYYFAPNPDSLQSIYMQISKELKPQNRKAYAVSSGDAMIYDVLPSYISLDTSSLRVTSNNSAHIRLSTSQVVGSVTELKWFIDTISFGETFEIQYKITSNRIGMQKINLTWLTDPLNYSRAYFKDLNGVLHTQSFPDDSIYVRGGYKLSIDTVYGSASQAALRLTEISQISMKVTDTPKLYAKLFTKNGGVVSQFQSLKKAAWQMLTWPDNNARQAFNSQYGSGHEVESVTVVSIRPGTGSIAVTYYDPQLKSDFYDTLQVTINPGAETRENIELTAPSASVPCTTFVDTVTLDSSFHGTQPLYFVGRDVYGNMVKMLTVSSWASSNTSYLTVTPRASDVGVGDYAKTGDPVSTQYVKVDANGGTGEHDDIIFKIIAYDYNRVVIKDRNGNPVGGTLTLSTDSIIDLYVWGEYQIGGNTLYDVVSGQWLKDGNEVFSGHHYSFTPTDTGTYQYIVDYGNGKLKDTVTVHIVPGSAQTIKISLINPNDSIKAGVPFGVKIEAFDKLGIKTPNFDASSLKLHTDLGVNDANVAFGYVNYAKNGTTDSVEVGTAYGTPLALHLTSGSDTFSVTVVNSSSKRQYLTGWDFGVTNDSDQIAIDIYPGAYYQMILVNPFSQQQFQPVGKARCRVITGACSGVDTVVLGVNTALEDITLASVAVDRYGNMLMDNNPPGGVQSLWGVRGSLAPLSLTNTDMQQVSARGRENSSGYVTAVCTRFNPDPDSANNRDSVYIIIDNPAFLDTLYYMDSLYSGQWEGTGSTNPVNGANGYVDLVELVFNGKIQFNFPKSQVNQLCTLTEGEGGLAWNILDVEYNNGGVWQSVWDNTGASLVVKADRFRMKLADHTTGALETDLHGNESGSRIWIKFARSDSDSVAWGRTFFTSRCWYVDRCAPVLQNAEFNGKICEPGASAVLRLVFSEDVEDIGNVLGMVKTALETINELKNTLKNMAPPLIY